MGKRMLIGIVFIFTSSAAVVGAADFSEKDTDCGLRIDYKLVNSMYLELTPMIGEIAKAADQEPNQLRALELYSSLQEIQDILGVGLDSVLPLRDQLLMDPGKSDLVLTNMLVEHWAGSLVAQVDQNHRDISEQIGRAHV